MPWTRVGHLGRWLSRRPVVVGLAIGALCTVAVAVLAAGVVSRRSPDRAAEIRLFKTEGVRWIAAERDRHYPYASALDERDLGVLAPYFSEHVLATARVRILEEFENPEFFSVFKDAGRPYPIDLRLASGLALIDTILISESSSRRSSRSEILFHELVHIVQYDVLGLEDYMERYVEAWAENGERYRAIPHEIQAYELTRRFRDPGASLFPVEAEVRALFSN